MTEHEWLVSSRAATLLKYARSLPLTSGRAARSRRLRLAGCAAVRMLWDEFEDNVLRRAVEVAEMLADGEEEAQGADWMRRELENTLHWLKHANLCYRLLDERPGVVAETHALIRNPRVDLCDRIRDIFGNPFRKLEFQSTWRTSTAVALAAHMYDQREFSTMPILADALVEAGCENEEILVHCRNSDGVHVRGCWLVDRLMGRK